MTLVEKMTRCTWLVHYHYRKDGNEWNVNHINWLRIKLVVIIVKINFGFGIVYGMMTSG